VHPYKEPDTQATLWLQELVEQIDKRFGENFAKIGAAGQVSLKEHEDFDKFACEIR
jgi:hypothetical protein